MKDIAQTFLSAMKEKNWSYSDLAKQTGIAKSSLQRYFTGETGKIPLDCIVPICRALGLDPSEALGWEDSNHARQNEILKAFRKKPSLSSLFDRVKGLDDGEIDRVNEVVRLMFGE